MEEFLSVCDGIGAAQEAWAPLGWRPVLLSEIDPFPRAVLRHRHQAVDAALSVRPPASVPMWGDFTALRPRHFERFGIRLPSLLVGGTPCQDFSIAGLRAGLDGDRGNLTLQFIRLANAIDNLRAARGLPPLVIVWENVPGVLSDKKNAFGCFLGALVGADAPLVPGRKQRWTDSGLVVGPRRAAAWRTLDAQYFGLAQRRRRVFVVSSARDGFDPSAVLFEPEGVRRDTPPRREAGQIPAASLTASTGGVSHKDDAPGRVVAAGRHGDGDGAGGGQPHDLAATLTGGGRRDGGYSHDDVPMVPEVVSTIDASFHRLQGASGQDANHGHSHLVPMAFGGNNRSGPIDVAASLSANKTGSGQFYDFTVETFILEPVACVTGEVTHTLKADGFDASEDGTGRGTPIVPAPSPKLYSIMPQNSGKDFKAREVDVAQPLMAGGPVGGNQGGDYILQPVGFNSREDPDVSGAISGPLGASLPQSQAIAFALRGRDDGAVPEVNENGDTIGTLRAADGGSSRDYVAYGIRSDAARAGVAKTPSPDAEGRVRLRDPGLGVYEELAPTMDASQPHSVAYNFEHGLAPHGSLEPSDTMPALTKSEGKGHSAVQVEAAVRRLTPVECERLQGFDDNFTLVPYRNGLAADGPRYKALGNSMAVPCMAWIGRRLQTHLEFIGPHKPVPPQHDEHFWAWLREEGLL